MQSFAVAVKSFIVREGKVLMIKRRPNDVHKPGGWDIPGGRLDLGEDPYKGVARETEEEVGIDIEILIPIGINHFMREDNQKITMIIFLCKPTSAEILLSEEHVEYKWQNINGPRNEFPKWLLSSVDNFLKFISL